MPRSSPGTKSFFYFGQKFLSDKEYFVQAEGQGMSVISYMLHHMGMKAQIILYIHHWKDQFWYISKA